MKCKRCGGAVFVVAMGDGSRMICDPEPVLYREARGGKKVVATQNGELLVCDYPVEPRRATGVGYRPHGDRCPEDGHDR